MPTSLCMSQMVDLALGTPELGAVNFNVLHTLLHAMLQKLDLSTVKADLSDEDRAALNGEKREGSVAGDSGITDSSRTVSPAYHALQNKVSKLEQQLEALNDLPSTEDLMRKTSDVATDPSSASSRPVADMWQTMQINRRVDNTEEGVNKLMTLVDDMMKELNDLKATNETLKQQMEKMNALDDMKDLMKRLEQLEQGVSSLKEQVDGQDFVTWASLEDAMKGIRQELRPRTPQERVVVEIASQTELPSRPGSSRISTPGPSAELQNVLERLGKLSDQHDSLEARVDDIEEQLKNKADKDALDALNVPDDLLKQIQDMSDQLSLLKKLQNKDSDALSRLQQVILQLQAEVERITALSKELTDENQSQQKHIDTLYSICSKLEEHKADKEFVQSEVDVKADKSLVDGKVNRNLFDQTCDELNKMINDILNKLLGHETEWRNTLDQLSSDLDGKLDRLEFGPIKEELEKQLKALRRKLAQLDMFDGPPGEDDAAGIRKQLLQRFHCISCDRPIEMMPQGPVPSIPVPNAMPTTRSARPYTTFELEQIRQHAKSTVQPFEPTSRACGGGHTITYPHHRSNRVPQINSIYREDDQPLYREEMGIRGQDGHIYKGRTADDTINFPNLGRQGTAVITAPKQGNESPKAQRKYIAPAQVGVRSTTPSSTAVRPPQGERVMRPSSARSSPRPMSARGLSGPQGPPHLNGTDDDGPPAARQFVPPPMEVPVAPPVEHPAEAVAAPAPTHTPTSAPNVDHSQVPVGGNT